MRIVNTSRHTTLSTATERAIRPVARLTGLMFRKAFAPGAALVIEPCNGIHTCFMRFPIDVLFVSKDWRVIRVLHSIRPWRFAPWVYGSRLVIELPAGTAMSTGTRAGDYIALTPD